LRILVVGAGISGATVAAIMAEDNEVTVIDSSDHIAGNCYDYRDRNGIMIHRYGSHIFHTSNRDVWDFLSRYTGFNTYMHRVIGLVDGNEVPIPFNFNTIQKVFPRTLADSIERKLLDNYRYDTKIPIMEFMKQDDSELRFLAEYIYENVFLHYTEKQWGSSPDEIDGAVTARVPVYISRDDRYFQDRFQGIPLEGYTKMIERMLDHPNIKVKLSTPFTEMDAASYDRVFYTGPVDELMDYCYGPLPYRSVRFRMEEYDREYYQSNSVVNYPNNYDFTRIHEYKYYLNDRSERTVIAKEYSEFFEPGKNERFYPIPKDENVQLYSKYLEAAKERYPNMVFLGRLGDYRYYDMDKAVARAMDVCRTVIG